MAHSTDRDDAGSNSRLGSSSIRCVVCGRSTPFDGVYRLGDGAFVCKRCLADCKIKEFPNSEEFTELEIRRYLFERKLLTADFEPNRVCFESALELDEAHGTFRANEGVYPYAALDGFDLLQSGETIDAEAASAALSETLDPVSIRIRLRDCPSTFVYVDCRKGSMLPAVRIRAVKQGLAALDRVLANRDTAHTIMNVPPSLIEEARTLDLIEATEIERAAKETLPAASGAPAAPSKPGKRCLVCDKKLPLLSKRALLADRNAICGDCLAELGLGDFDNSHSLDAHGFAKLVEARGGRGIRFHADKTAFNGQIQADERRDTLLINDTIYLDEDILSYELLDDGGDVVTKGGLGGAVVGGLLFGPVGAIVGGSTGKRKTSRKSFFKVRVTFSGGPSDLELIDYPLKTTAANKEIQGGLAILERACHRRDEIALAAASAPAAPVDAPPLGGDSPVGEDAADLIRKFKALADDGIITQEEFEAKKRQLLGL